MPHRTLCSRLVTLYVTTSVTTSSYLHCNRVYFHKTGDSETDYLVDHSIIMYLIDPAGEFVTFYGKNFTARQLADSIMQHIAKW